jgi:predicted  nucleic acid-binding Zn-ribbon protein
MRALKAQSAAKDKNIEQLQEQLRETAATSEATRQAMEIQQAALRDELANLQRVAAGHDNELEQAAQTHARQRAAADARIAELVAAETRAGEKERWNLLELEKLNLSLMAVEARAKAADRELKQQEGEHQAAQALVTQQAKQLDEATTQLQQTQQQLREMSEQAAQLHDIVRRMMAVPLTHAIFKAPQL